jgi:hypothetical protein
VQNGEQPPTTGELRLTYADIARRLGISNDAARQLVRRRGWRRIVPNRLGAPTTVVVPADELGAEEWRQDRPTSSDNQATTSVTSPVDRPSFPGDRPGQTSEINRLISLLTAAHERGDRAEHRADAADADRRAAEARAEAAEQRADRAERRADATQAELAGAQVALVGAETRLREAEAARAEFWSRSRFARLKGVWRGRGG